MLSVRTDRLWDPVYLARHYRHYGLLLLFALAAWSPQVLDTVHLYSVHKTGIWLRQELKK